MSILFDLWLINHLLSGALDEVLVDASGLTGEDFGFYSLLRRFGPLTPTQVSRWTAMPATTVSATVRRLAGRGHVEQVRNPADGRSRLIALTDAGVATHTATAAVFFTQTRPLATALGPDEQQQRLSLQRLDAALRQVSGLDPRPYAVSTTVAATTSEAAITEPAGAETSFTATEAGAGERAAGAWNHRSQLAYPGRTSDRTRRTRSAPTSISSAANGSE
jgi:DNA-binding MarR family transcriptional regulator